MNGQETADRVRELRAKPGMDDAAWVAEQIRQRGWEPFFVGQRLDPDDPIEAVFIAEIQRWAVLGGHNADPEALVTAAQVNRGRLVAAMLKEDVA